MTFSFVVPRNLVPDAPVVHQDDEPSGWRLSVELRDVAGVSASTEVA